MLVALGSLALLLSVFGGAGASASSVPTQGIFEGCSLGSELQSCVQRLEVMHQGGLQVVVIPAWGASLSSLAAYAAAAHSLGMSVMWELSNPGWWQDPASSTSMSGSFSAFSAACGCTQNGALLAYIAHWLGSQPGTYGYYAADDSMLSAGDQGGVANYVAQIKQQDPTHTLMIGAADESQAGTYQRMADVIGTEVYPVTTGSLLPVGSNQDMWDSVAQSAIDAQHTANGAGKASAFILQAFTWGDNLDDGQAIGACSPADTKWSCYTKLRYPSAAEQLQERNTILLHAHPKLILWYSFQGTYGQAGNDTYSIYPTGTQATTRWSGLASAITAPAPSTPVAHAPHKHRVRAHAAIARHHSRRHTRRHSRRHTRRHTRRHATRRR